MIGVKVKPGAENKVSWRKLLAIIVPPIADEISDQYEVPKGYVLWHIRLENGLANDEALGVQLAMAKELPGEWAKFDGADLRKGCVEAIKQGDKDKRERFVEDMCSTIVAAKNVFIWRASQIEECEEIATAIRARFAEKDGKRTTIIASSHSNNLDKLFTNVDRCEIIGKWEDISKASHGTLKNLEFPLPVEGMSANEKSKDETVQPSDDFVAALGEGFAALGDRLGGKLDSVVESVDGVKGEVTKVHSQVSSVKGEVASLKVEVGEVKKGVDAIPGKISDTLTAKDGVVDQIKTSVGDVVTAVANQPAAINKALLSEGGVVDQIKGSVDSVGTEVKSLQGELNKATLVARTERKTATRIALGLGGASLLLGGAAIYDSRQSSAESSQSVQESNESIRLILEEMRAEREASQDSSTTSASDADIGPPTP